MCINSLILQIILQTHTFLYNSLLIFKNIFVKNPKIKVFLREMSCWAGWYLRVFLPWPPQGGRQWPRALPQAVTRLVGFLTGAGHGGQGLLDLRQVRTYNKPTIVIPVCVKLNCQVCIYKQTSNCQLCLI